MNRTWGQRKVHQINYSNLVLETTFVSARKVPLWSRCNCTHYFSLYWENSFAFSASETTFLVIPIATAFIGFSSLDFCFCREHYVDIWYRWHCMSWDDDTFEGFQGNDVFVAFVCKFPRIKFSCCSCKNFQGAEVPVTVSSACRGLKIRASEEGKKARFSSEGKYSKKVYW